MIDCMDDKKSSINGKIFVYICGVFFFWENWWSVDFWVGRIR